jgi:hypothetical protein
MEKMKIFSTFSPEKQVQEDKELTETWFLSQPKENFLYYESIFIL